MCTLKNSKTKRLPGGVAEPELRLSLRLRRRFEYLESCIVGPTEIWLQHKNAGRTVNVDGFSSMSTSHGEETGGEEPCLSRGKY